MFICYEGMEMRICLNSFFQGILFVLQRCKFDDVFLKVKQYKILDIILSGKDVIGVLPTGYGKSIIFQLLPYIYIYIYEYHSGRELIVLVIAPLNALIEDQLHSKQFFFILSQSKLQFGII